MEFLIGSPFSSPVGQRIERATSAALHAEDWALNMEICDIINETDEGPKDAVRAIKKRIVGNKSFREIMLALTVLEACVKNCGHRFHVLVASQDFVEGVLVRAILPKNNPPTTLHDRVLSLIQAWADAFRSSPSLGGVVCVYEDLRRRGLEFPMTDLDALSPIHTPLRSIPENDSSVTVPAPPPQSQTPRGPAASSPTQAALTAVPPQLSDGPVSISPEQAQKLRVDLALVRGNLTVMTEMLNQLTPGQSPQEDSELLQQLYQVCREMQSRVVELIPRLLDEGLIEELLVVNDDLNNAFLRYDRFDRLNKAQRTATEQTPARANLIDLSPVSQSLSQPETNSVAASQPAFSAPSNQRQAANHTCLCASGAPEEDEFDMFAQTRGSSLADQRKSMRYEDPGAVEGLAGALDTRLQVTGAIPSSKPGLKNSTLGDIDRWLSADTETQPEAGDREGLSSEEFDKFLEERAKVADHIPSTHSLPPVSSRPPPQSARPQESSHDQLFSL
ncbi:target of Myb1 membrane trafficking protein-like isoform X2 [Oncorhynchus keta]|uniref:target of Myb1 membrane trafficking protein-like isoform X2 n=1 Tax=Oncorhynchus keta TaxID=8018 RepID=UPI00227B0841|nr:target of Myb1 membrane trafficking protein-like isoform X2 [Oncorhynchus keta]